MRNNRRNGAAMVMCLGVLAMMAILAATFLTFTRLNNDATRARSYTVRMDLLANGVLQQIRILLAKDLERQSEKFDHARFDPWLSSLLPDSANRFRYISRLDQADNAWEINNPGGAVTPAALGGRAPENVFTGGAAQGGTFLMQMALDKSGRATVPTGRMDSIASPFYVDADGDGLADSLLTGIGVGNNNNSGGIVFHDGSSAVVGVRIIDNAHFNPRQHAKWSPRGDGVYQDYTTGLVDWRRSVDTFGGGPNISNRRLPHVNLRGIRMDGAPTNWDAAFDRILHTDGVINTTTAPDGISLNNLGLSQPFMPGWHTIFGGSSALINNPTNRPEICPPPFNLEDEIALRLLGSDAGVSKYIANWPLTWAPINDTTHRERRVTNSGVTRERTSRWMNSPAGGGPVLATPFDLRKILTGAGDVADGRLTTLYNWMGVNGVLPNTARRAQFLANLAEYIRQPSVMGQPRQYNIGGNVVYGVCRQPFLVEMIRDGGTAGNLAVGASRDFNSVRLGVELYNPYPDPILLSGYQLEFRSEATATAGIFPAAQGQTNPIMFDLSPLTIQPFQSMWLATDSVTLNQILPTTAPNDLRRAGPRLVVSLKATPTVGAPIVMDTIDTRATGRAGAVMNSAGGGGTPIDWSDWDGTGLAGQDLTNFNLTITNTTMWEVPAAATANVMWSSNRSGIYRPQGTRTDGTFPPRIVVDASNATAYARRSAACTTTNLWRGYRVAATAATTLHSNTTVLTDSVGARSSPTRINAAQLAPGTYTPAVLTGNAFNEPFIFGAPVFLPNRGVDSNHGAKFHNLGELAHVMTVGNNPNAPYTEEIAAASILAQQAVANYMSGVAAPVPGGAVPANSWAWIDFERRFKFDILEGGAGVYNANIFNIASLYMGNGGSASADADFSPYSGALDDTSEDLLPNGASARAMFREGRININTSPRIVLLNLPWPQGARGGGNINGMGYSPYDSFARALVDPPGATALTPNGGYLNQLNPPGGLDPYFAEPADIFAYSLAWGAIQGVNNGGGPLMGWDQLMYNAGTGSYIGSDGVLAFPAAPYKHRGFRQIPHMHANTFPTLAAPVGGLRMFYSAESTAGPGLVLRDYAEQSCAAGLAQRDALWAPMTNVLSTRADVFTAFILIKLVRPTPNVVQFLSGNQRFEDLGEVRLVAIIDRSNTRIDPATGLVDMSNPAYLPRILSRQFQEQF